VLDLGCGAGQLAHYLATRGAAEVIGVDVSERMLELARAQWAHPRVSYQRISIEEVSFAPAHFDLVVSVLALHYVTTIAGWWRALRSGSYPAEWSCIRQSTRSTPRGCRTTAGCARRRNARDGR
jgi:2-polyprenyl-3-methyl-5-hydroxy-6-metoxy-1,4-benzoquinol methylase